MTSSGDGGATTPAASEPAGSDARSGVLLPPFRLRGRLAAILGPRRGEATQRLAAEMAQTWLRASGRGEDGKEYSPRALKLVDLAAAELRDGHREAGWALALAARRELVEAATGVEREALTVSVREQAGKLHGWRRRAVERLVPADGPPPSAAELAEAFEHIDEFNSNLARAQRVLRSELLILSSVLLAAVVGLWLSLIAWLPAASPPGTAAASSALAGVPTERLAILAMLFGVVGACMSSLQRATSRPRRSVPKLRETMWASLTRPVIGAAAGLVVWALGAEGILGDKGLGFLGLAFAAGFSERLVLRLIPMPDGADEPDRPSGPGSAEGGTEPSGIARSPGGATTFRANVGIAVLDGAGRVLELRRADHPEVWQLPQGGIEPGETPEVAAWRELAEETGLGGRQVRLAGAMDHWLAYELPEQLRSAKTGRGQVQLWHAFRLTDPNPSVTPGNEFVDVRWADWDQAIADAVRFRQPVYRQVRDFVDGLGPGA